MTTQSIRKAARILENDGVIAYPTEGVFGFGCLPESISAVARILSIKDRDPAMGFVLIASRPEQIAPLADMEIDPATLESTEEQPVTWIVPASDEVPYWIRGDHPGVAIRLTAHPVAAALCDAVDSPLVSTSANESGRPPARNIHVLRRQFGDRVDYIVPGACGPASGPSEIRDLATGKVIRPATE